MTSPALLVLFLAHVGSIFGTASDPAADYDKNLTNQPKMGYHTTRSSRLHRWTNFHKNLDENNSELHGNNNNIHIEKPIHKINDKYDEIYVEETETSEVNIDKANLKFKNSEIVRDFRESKIIGQRSKREVDKCALFKNINNYILHPHPNDRKNNTYYRNANCVTVVEAERGKVIELTFVDQFQIEHHADCKYDYLEIRDGKQGYDKLLGKLCGDTFPPLIQTSGPFAWLKFKSDDTIEYSGFKIHINYKSGAGNVVPDSCYIEETGKRHGILNLGTINNKCRKESINLDVLWTITTPVNTKIYLNITKFSLAAPNECEQNIVEVFGSEPETDSRLVQYCGSIANPISTKDEKENSKEPGNKMHVRVFVTGPNINKTEFKATYIAYRTLNPNNMGETCNADEFDCDDNTCIAYELRCDEEHEAHCRLKTDEDVDMCAPEAGSTISQPHILTILIIFSLILSAMSFVFLYKCIKKLVEDHKIIKEHIRQSCEDRLDNISSRLTLDAKQLQRDSEPRASLERENRANEMYKRHRDSFSKRKPSSIDSDYIQETHLDIDEEPWRRDVDDAPEASDVRIERNGRSRHSHKERRERRSERDSEKKNERRSDMSKKEESIRSKREKEESEKKEIRDASVGPPDTKDSGCQTRESLFQTDAPPSSEGSGTTGTNSRGFSTFGYSGATIARPSPPATKTSEMTIELLRQVPRQDSVKPQKKMDRRPISTETTRSAPDVIIVSRPIR